MLNLTPRSPIVAPLPSDGQWQALRRRLMFSAREFDIARLIVEKDEKESTIARRLGISVHTVHIHLNRLFVKVGVHSRAQLIVMVFREFEAHIRQP